jgi:CHAT domain-containing protein
VSIKVVTKQPDGEAESLDGLMRAYKETGDMALATFYGKRAVNIFQEIRGSIKNLERGAQRGFLTEKEKTYRTLADLLISEGRLPEAQRVLELLKDEEYAKLLVTRGGADRRDGLPYNGAETAALKTLDRLAEAGRERGELLSKVDDKSITAEGRRRLDELDAEITAANRLLRSTLDAIARAAADAGARVDKGRKAHALQSDLRQLGAGTAALYTVVAKEGSWIVLITPDFRKAYPVDPQGLEQTVFEFRRALVRPNHDPRPLAQKLYRMLMQQTSPRQKSTLAADLDAYLAGSPNKTLMWSLDGALRYVPIAALHDGERYLVESYRNVIFTTASLPRLKDAVSARWEALGLGVSEAREGFAPLANVERELRSIIREKNAPAATVTDASLAGVLPGTIKLNRDFTEKALADGLKDGYPVIHIASHFRYEPASVKDSFLLLSDGNRLTIEALQDKPDIFARVDLLTLAACDTALADGVNGKEVEGLAYVAQYLGAKAVVASLWQVDDAGTNELMRRFYRLR